MPKLYFETRNGVPVAYRYGEEIEATKLWVEGGYPTPEAAKEAWALSQKSDVEFCIDCGKHQPYRVEKRRIGGFARGISFEHDELYAVCAECGSELYVPKINDLNVDAVLAAYQKAKERGALTHDGE